MYSPVCCHAVSHTMTNKTNKPTNKQLRAAYGNAMQNKQAFDSIVNRKPKQNRINMTPLVSSVVSRQENNFPRINTTRDIVTIYNTEASDTVPDVGGTAAFTCAINPRAKTIASNNLLFPWLSTVASAFGAYRFKYLRIMYSPAVGTTTAGQVAIALSYDTASAGGTLPTSLAEVSAIARSGTGPVWTGSTINDAVAFAPRTSPILSEVIYTDLLPLAEQDKQWYAVGASTTSSSIGSFPASLLAYNTSSAAVVTGSLYLAYCVEFKDPVPARQDI